MRKVILDTNAYSQLFRDDNDPLLDTLDQVDEIFMSVIVMGELFAGFRGGKNYSKNVDELNEFLDEPIVKIINITEETAEIFGEIKDSLKRLGYPLPLNDVWIASQCLELGGVLISYDRHFTQVHGLRFIHP